MKKPFTFNLSQYRITLRTADGDQDVDKRSIDFLSRELPKAPGKTLNDLYHWLNDDAMAAAQQKAGIANPQTFARHYVLEQLAGNRLTVQREGMPVIAGDSAAEEAEPGPEQSAVAKRQQQSTPPPTPIPPPSTTSSTEAVSQHEPASTPPGGQLDRVGDPVIPLTGEEWLQVTDLEIPGPLPLSWTRHYRSSHREREVGLGAGWFTPFHTRVRAEADQMVWTDPEGRRVRFAKPQPGGRSYQTAEGLCLVEREGTLTIFGRDSRHWVFQPAPQGWRLNHCSEPGGQALHCHYDDRNRLVAITNDQERGIRCEYGADGRIAQLLRIAPNTARPRMVARYHFDGQGDLVRSEDASGQAESLQYRSHLLVRRTLRSGFSYHFDWDAQGRCTRHYGDDGHYDYRFDYQPGVTRATDATGNVTVYQFDTRGLCTAYLDCHGYETRRRYDAIGRLIEAQTPSDATTRWTYDDRGRLSRIRYADGSEERFAYNDLNHPLQHLDRAGQLWRRTYDPLGRLRSLTDPEGDTWTYHYNAHGLLTSTTGPDGSQYRYAYNAAGDRIAERQPGGALTEWLYDADGQLIAQLDAEGQLTRYQYNAAGQVITVATALHVDHLKTAWAELAHQPGTRLEHFAYDSAGRLTYYTDATGRTTQYRYGGLSQPVERIDPAGRRLQFEYDHERRLTALIDAQGQRATWEYDGNGKVIEHQDFTGRTQRFSYDADGHLIARHEPHHRHKLERDKAGRLVQRTSIDTRTGDSRIVRFRYDGLGRLIEAVSPGHTLRFRYNSQNQLLEEWQNGRAVHHRYDACGRRIRSSDDQQQVDYRYDPLGHLDSILLNGKGIVQFQRDALGRELSRHYANGHQCESRYDGRGQLAQCLWRSPAETEWQEDYRYDPSGRLLGIHSPQEQRLFDYDPAGRLKSVDGSWQERIQQTADGTLTEMQVIRAGQPLPLSSLLSKGFGAQSLAISVDDTPASIEPGTPTERYDNSGLLERLTTTDTTLRLRYQPDGQLAQAENGRDTVRYDYDALGRRWRKQSSQGTVEFVWCGDVLWQEIHHDQQTHYLFEPDSFRPLLKIEGDRHYYYHNDHLGTPQRVTDDQGQVAWSAELLAYGGIAQETHSGTDNPLRFPGQYHDRETGLYYNRFRYYSPLLGRYVQPDPLGLKGGLNVYQYTLNPLQHTDPLGLCNETAQAVTADTGAAIATGKDVTQMLPDTGAHQDLQPGITANNPSNPTIDFSGNAHDGAKLNNELVPDTGGPKVDMHHIQGEVNPNKWIPKLKIKMPSGTGGHYRNPNIRVTNEITPRNSLGVYEAQIEVFDSVNDAWVPKLNPKGKLGKSSMFPDQWDEPKIIQQIQEAYIDAGTPTSGKWTGEASSGLKIQGYVDESSKPFDIRTAWPVYEDN